jgi:genome maintenance exonuclease 1
MEIKKQNIEFQEDGHTYTMGGKLLTGVTTVLDVRAKDFLKWWTVKLMYQTLLPKLKEVQGISEEEWEKILLEAKKAHTVKSKEALVSGTIAHDWIEKYIKGEKNDLPEDEKARNAINEFLSWEKEHRVEWIASELVVASPEHQYAGTIDFIARIDGKLTLGDFKTSSQISEDYYLQTAAYQMALEPLIDEPIEQRVILRIPKDGTEFEYQIVPTGVEFDKKTFLALREAHRWNVYIENMKEYKKEKVGEKIN